LTFSLGRFNLTSVFKESQYQAPYLRIGILSL